eukprot:2857818-Prorocentrum_lima.AAC.1
METSTGQQLVLDVEGNIPYLDAQRKMLTFAVAESSDITVDGHDAGTLDRWKCISMGHNVGV